MADDPRATLQGLVPRRRAQCAQRGLIHLAVAFATRGGLGHPAEVVYFRQLASKMVHAEGTDDVAEYDCAASEISVILARPLKWLAQSASREEVVAAEEVCDLGPRRHATLTPLFLANVHALGQVRQERFMFPQGSMSPCSRIHPCWYLLCAF